MDRFFKNLHRKFLDIILIDNRFVFRVQYAGGVTFWIFVLTGAQCPEKSGQTDGTKPYGYGDKVKQGFHISV